MTRVEAMVHNLHFTTCMQIRFSDPPVLAHSQSQKAIKLKFLAFHEVVDANQLDQPQYRSTASAPSRSLLGQSVLLGDAARYSAKEPCVVSQAMCSPA